MLPNNPCKHLFMPSSKIFDNKSQKAYPPSPKTFRRAIPSNSPEEKIPHPKSIRF